MVKVNYYHPKLGYITPTAEQLEALKRRMYEGLARIVKEGKKK